MSQQRPKEHSRRIVLAALVCALSACAQVRVLAPPPAHTLRTASDARAAADSAGTALVILNGIIPRYAVFDSIPAGEVVGFELVNGSGVPGQPVVLITRCSFADTTHRRFRRAVISRFPACPWSLAPKAER